MRANGYYWVELSSGGRTCVLLNEKGAFWTGITDVTPTLEFEELVKKGSIQILSKVLPPPNTVGHNVQFVFLSELL